MIVKRRRNSQEEKDVDILVTIDANYIHPLTVMLKSLAVSNLNEESITVYVMSRDLTEKHIAIIRDAIREPRVRLSLCRVDEPIIHAAPSSRRYPLTIYDRLFAAFYLPESLDRILYLDPDLVVIRPLDQLWSLPLGNHLYAAASHLGKAGDIFNSVRVDAEKVVPYFNSGVLLMNLAALRAEQDPQKVVAYIANHWESLLLPDQDILTGLYGKRIIPIDPYIYNMTERLLTRAALRPQSEVNAQWVLENSCIVHYIGRNKPWKPHYHGKLGGLYTKYEQMLKVP